MYIITSPCTYIHIYIYICSYKYNIYIYNISYLYIFLCVHHDVIDIPQPPGALHGPCIFWLLTWWNNIKQVYHCLLYSIKMDTFWVLLFNASEYPVIFSPFLYGHHHDRLVTPERPRSLCIACQLNDLFNLPSDIDAQSPPLWTIPPAYVLTI